MENQARSNELSVKCTIYGDLHAKIMTGQVRVGERLLEVDLAIAYNASRTPVRRALTALAAKGLICHDAGGGWFVASPRPRDFAQVALVRVFLESQAVALATSHVSEALVAELECLLSQMDIALSDENPSRYGTLNERFHRTIYAKCNNPKLTKILEDIFREYPNLAYPVLPSASAQRQREHYRIVEAIVSRQPDRAQQLTRDHFSRHFEAILGVDLIA